MKIGILHEGFLDAESIKIIVLRIIEHVGVEVPIEFDLYRANGPIIGKMPAAQKRFFECEKPCDFGIFISDIDRVLHKKKQIENWIKSQKKSHPHHIISCCPDPTLEIWFLREENCIKQKYRSLNASAPLPYENLHPKEQIQKIIIAHDEITASPKDVYPELAKLLNLSLLASKDAIFDKFYKQLIFACKKR
jgi:hypothetical protein